jgi:hypothetical protein
MRGLLIVIGLCLLNTSLLVGVQWIGTSQPFDSEMIRLVREVPFTSDGWCWRGLCMEGTTLAEADAQLRQNAAFSDLNVTDYIVEGFLRWQWQAQKQRIGSFTPAYARDALNVFTIYTAFDKLTISEMVHLFGTPQQMYIQTSNGLNDLIFQICFEHDVCVVVLEYDGRLRPASPIYMLSFMNLTSEVPNTILTPARWRGFTRYSAK